MTNGETVARALPVIMHRTNTTACRCDLQMHGLYPKHRAVRCWMEILHEYNVRYCPDRGSRLHLHNSARLKRAGVTTGKNVSSLPES